MKIVTILLLLLLLFFGVGFATGSGRPGDSGAVEVAPSPAAEGYAHPEWLVDPGSLQGLAARPEVKVIALTTAADFAAGHVPGAVQIDWPGLEIVETSDQSVATWRKSVEATLTALGVSTGDTVVIYDGGTVYAPRLWWILDQLGHRDKRILNGGYPAWTAAGLPVETGASTPRPAATPYVGMPDERAIATLDEVKAHLAAGDAAFVDARAPKEYAAGHIPGAANVQFTENAAATDPKRWKSAGELRAMYADLGVTPERLVIPYCSTGVRSAATYFTLRLIGYEDVSLFTGSWKEWSRHPELPVTTGAAP